MSRILLILSVTFVILHLVSIINGGESGDEGTDLDQDAMDGSRGIGFRPKKKNKTTTVRPTWRPAIPSKQLLAEQKGLNQIPSDESDPEFKYLWPDDYYDDYTFESKKSMLQHGTFESKIQNYHEAEFNEAVAKLKHQNENESSTPE